MVLDHFVGLGRLEGQALSRLSPAQTIARKIRFSGGISTLVGVSKRVLPEQVALFSHLVPGRELADARID